MIKFCATAADASIIGKIIDRTEQLSVKAGYARRDFDRMGRTMDITACHLNGCPLKLQELLDADDFNFSHDVFGITRYMDRTTGQLTDCFLPRYAAPCRDELATDPLPMRRRIKAKRVAEANRQSPAA